MEFAKPCICIFTLFNPFIASRLASSKAMKKCLLVHAGLPFSHPFEANLAHCFHAPRHALVYCCALYNANLSSVTKAHHCKERDGRLCSHLGKRTGIHRLHKTISRLRVTRRRQGTTMNNESPKASLRTPVPPQTRTSFPHFPMTSRIARTC